MLISKRIIEIEMFFLQIYEGRFRLIVHFQEDMCEDGG